MTDSAKLDLLLSEMQEMKTGMLEMKTDMLEMKTDMQQMKTDMLETKADMLEMKTETQELKRTTQTLSQRVDIIESKVIHTELILENEIRVNIQRIAEGHLDLSRNLHDAMQPSNEVEMLAIRVRMLESDVKELKSKLA
ncbi:MAG: hypothetical protein K2N43_00785 [Lachnospiraceae bacterium]|nr:hypothetical protein [Lachnospiraceae bacterium]